MPQHIWRIFLSKKLAGIYEKLKKDAFELLEKDSKANRNHPKVRDFERLCKAIQTAADNPHDSSYLLGNTLGERHRSWRRIKHNVPTRYRLFFKFFSSTKEIFFMWMNDSEHIRRAGSRSDVYRDMERRLDSGKIPEDRESMTEDSIEYHYDSFKSDPDPPIG